MIKLEQKIGYLKTIDIFQDLSKEEMLKIEKSITMSTCKAGKVFFRPEDTAQVLFILKRGRVQFYKISPEGKKLIVSTITDHTTNIYLVDYIAKHNPRAVLICHADSPSEASELYSLGATYVLMPHYLGSEKIGSFIKRNGFKKSEFNKYREKHLIYLETHSR